MFPKARAWSGAEGPVQERRHLAGDRHRRAGDSDCRHIGKVWPARPSSKSRAWWMCPLAPPLPRPAANDELMREVEAWIEAEMRRLDPEAYPAEPQPWPRPHPGRQRRLNSRRATLPCASTPHNATRRCPPLTAPAHGVAARGGWQPVMKRLVQLAWIFDARRGAWHSATARRFACPPAQRHSAQRAWPSGLKPKCLQAHPQSAASS